MTAPDKALVQQLAEQIVWRVGDVRGWPDWMQSVVLGRDQRPIVERVLAAALASGLVVPAEPVRQVAARYDGRRTNGSAVANRLRAILGDPQHQEKQ